MTVVFASMIGEASVLFRGSTGASATGATTSAVLTGSAVTGAASITGLGEATTGFTFCGLIAFATGAAYSTTGCGADTASITGLGDALAATFFGFDFNSCLNLSRSVSTSNMPLELT